MSSIIPVSTRPCDGHRPMCEPPAAVQSILDNEDAMSSTLQPVAALPEMAAAGEKPPAPVINPDPYAGPAYPR